jgi:heat shock protein HslJ
VPDITGDWQVLSIEGFDTIADSKASMSFQKDGMLSGSTGCNSYGSAYTMNGSSLSIDAGWSTRKMCMARLNEQELRFFQAMSSVVAVDRIDESEMYLVDVEGNKLFELRKTNSNGKDTD